MRFHARNGRARRAEFATAHGVIQTPVFMPVGTRATVKTLSPADLRAIGAEIILANTYHLFIRPGHGLIERLGGLHSFMAWDRSILTDSGGFQVVSLTDLRKVDDEGVTFRSHIDGSQLRFTPESVVTTQEALGADIAMAFDHPPAWGSSDSEAAQATLRSLSWAERCRKAHGRANQMLFGICQGGFAAEARAESARAIAGLDFVGNAIGGLSVGEPKELLWPLLAASLGSLPEDRPRYVMGMGAPEDLLAAIAMGADMFDCVLPTRLGRNGAFFTRGGRQNIGNARFREVPGPLDAECDCEACRVHSTTYIHHLFRVDEILGLRLLSLHNTRFLIRLMEQSRTAIESGDFGEFALEFLGRYGPTNASCLQARVAIVDAMRP
ncbi:MAG: tRNA guanosine(34) transglycosylase Tgt [Chloroflexota bacterium]|nr:MAG: tRNA guanosine(34) transglycosylase Tgt [Chloroflexota bacterium]